MTLLAILYTITGNSIFFIYIYIGTCTFYDSLVFDISKLSLEFDFTIKLSLRYKHIMYNILHLIWQIYQHLQEYNVLHVLSSMQQHSLFCSVIK